MTHTQEYQMVLLQPQGHLDMQGGEDLKQLLAGLVSQPQDLWAINLASVDFIDCYGLVALVTGLKATRQSGCRLVLCNMQAPVRIVFELTQLDEVFEIFESYDAVLTTVEAVVLAA